MSGTPTQIARAARIIAACAICFCAACADETRPPAIAFHTNEAEREYGAVDVAPISVSTLTAIGRLAPSAEVWQEVFAVRAGDTAALPMLGTYLITYDTLRFFPRFPPVPGSAYYAQFNSAAMRARTGKRTPTSDARGTWRLSARIGTPTTLVNAIYPSTDVVPMNLLRVYIEFSAPMTVGEAESRVHLVDENGRVVEKAFLVAAGGQELWDGDHRRITVFFDPGRIKRDLTPHEQLGLPLQQGHSYRLVVDSMWTDAKGVRLKSGFEKQFRVGPIDRELVRTSQWRVQNPGAGARMPLTVIFPKPLDRALAQRMLVVKRSDGTSVPGMVTLDAREMVWRFTPSDAWRAGEYYVEVDTDLEDLAGNNLRRPFDVMPGDAAARGPDATVVQLKFSVRGS